MNPPRALLIGYGNPARGDDGLGPAFAELIADRALPGLTVDVDFQLMTDHALTISKHDLVVFADAALGKDGPFQFNELVSTPPQNMGSHSVTPAAAIALAAMLFQGTPKAFVMGISGYRFGEIEEGLSAGAGQNLNLAETYFLDWYAQQSKRRLEHFGEV